MPARVVGDSYLKQRKGKAKVARVHSIARLIDNVRIRQSGGRYGDDVLIDLKEQMMSMVNDARQMRMKMKGMLLRNFDESRVVIVLCLSIFLIIITVIAMKNWGSKIGVFDFFREVFWP